MWAVVGLGNPGAEYAGTRHNAGFAFVQGVARAWSVRLQKRKFQARTAEAVRRRETILLAQPQTYMNASGQSVRLILQGTGLDAERLVVVYDDLDVRLGEVRVRAAGRAGTHKGMQSVVAAVGTIRFPRIRIGIGPLPEGEDAAAYVLAPFAHDERPLIEAGLERARGALDLILAGRLEKAMTVANQKTEAA
ncbi:MAG: aminoacyl-tRNA hydrolase [Candidatus Aminicenantes bacterium]|nr:aminoacyl-tRNA hydrolase [Candidatus Aminicenantes bacterium]